MGLAGGTTGSAVAAALRQFAVPTAFTAAVGETRRTFAVVDGTGSAAGQATVPVSVHLDHASTVELVEAAAELGLPAVMYDASALPYQDNVRATTEVTHWCHERGI
jgi:fructose/tagatose bisphosphate aldolase